MATTTLAIAAAITGTIAVIAEDAVAAEIGATTMTAEMAAMEGAVGVGSDVAVTVDAEATLVADLEEVMISRRSSMVEEVEARVDLDGTRMMKLGMTYRRRSHVETTVLHVTSLLKNSSSRNAIIPKRNP